MKLDRELDGLLVVSLEQAVAAPYAGLLLADAGARVIKIERPEGDFARGYDAGAGGQSAIFAWLNRGKESIRLNLKDADDMAVLRSMLRRADVLLSNLAPGALARMGLSGKALRKDNPGLITCAITGYGETGAAAKKKAYDFLVQAESGICSVTGTEEIPSRVGVSLTDLSTGLTAFSAILRALIQRGRSGQGADLSIAMFDVMADWMNLPLMAHRYGGGAPPRTGLQHSFIAPYGAFWCKGGAQVLLSVQSNREWAAFCHDVLQRPELTSDPRFADNPVRYINRSDLDAIVNDVFGKLERGAVLDRLDRAGIANATLNSVADLSEHPFLCNASAVIGGTEIEVAALPVRSGPDTPTAVPGLGEHDDILRREFPGDP
ncbi:Formyl-coenzyme A transferase [Roseovarius litorisediminis]|uniref:Formyl-coenzyme A transferase n=1 Tax=Roseovarius litorisediminis TaxID=1312363 RepID=A0A1Y5S4L4_9RHOB|nr:CaiB/BaiF CoA-transferase family protein [Roseovarius litorisediminis]SLN32470.1 Formyl-coenzyme A transferase [Roseovarius litorisediminis]